MTSQCLPEFWERCAGLPTVVRQAAREAFARFSNDPYHPGLRFKQLTGYPDYWSVRVTRSYRAVGRRTGDSVVWFWIGSHAEFDKDFA